MKLALVTVGSRGDVEPYIALGQRLQQRGHSVRLAALALFERHVAGAGLEFHSLGALPGRFKPSTGGDDGAPSRRDASTLFRGLAGRALFWAFFPGMLAPALDRFISACEGADVAVYTRLALPVPHVAERLGIPCFAGFPVPHTPTRAFENPLYVGAAAPGPLRTRATYAIEWALTHQLSYGLLARFRRERLGLPAVRRGALRAHLARAVQGTLYSYSEAVLPRPDDWPESVQVTGYWSCPPPSSSEDELRHWCLAQVVALWNRVCTIEGNTFDEYVQRSGVRLPVSLLRRKAVVLGVLHAWPAIAALLVRRLPGGRRTQLAQCPAATRPLFGLPRDGFLGRDRARASRRHVRAAVWTEPVLY